MSSIIRTDFMQRSDLLSDTETVNIIDKGTVYLSGFIEFFDNVTIEPFVVIVGPVKIGNNVTIKSFSYLEGVEIGDNSVIGPFARIRPDTEIGKNVKIGCFVDISKSIIGAGTKISHLSCCSMANIGENVIFGAGSVIANYDGENKHESTVNNNTLLGSNSTIVSPVKIGENCIIAAGSVMTNDVPDDNLGIARSRQENKIRKK